MTGRASNKRTYSVYLDEVEDAAVHRVARENHLSPNAVCRALIRAGLGLPAAELRLPAEVVDLAAARTRAARAEAALR